MNIYVERALALIGCRFRPQGRVPEIGLDCIGVACVTYRLPVDEIPRDYRLRTSDQARFQPLLRRFFSTVRQGRPGDLLLMRIGKGQLHVAVTSDTGFVHAHAGLRKVVETPGKPPWPILSIHHPKRILER